MNRITSVRITAFPKSFGDPLPVVYVTIDGIETKLFDFYPDEISFTENEFIGLTLDEARSLKFNKDRSYLQS